MHISQTEAGCLIKAEGDLTIYTAADNAARLQQAMEPGCTQVVVDLSAIDEIDTSGLQLLLQMKKTCELRNLPISFRSPSPAILEIVQLLELHDFFSFSPEVLEIAVEEDQP